MHSTERWPIVLCGFLCLQASSVLAGFERRCNSATYDRGTHSQGLCGSRLSDTVSLVCGGSVNINILDNKRDVPSWHYGHHRYRKREASGLDKNKPETTKLKNKLGKLLLGKKDAVAYLKSKRSTISEQGIVCECCYFSCSYYELTQYCITPPQGYLRRKRSLQSNDLD